MDIPFISAFFLKRTKRTTRLSRANGGRIVVTYDIITRYSKAIAFTRDILVWSNFSFSCYAYQQNGMFVLRN